MKNDGLKSYLQSYFQYMGINCLKCVLDNEQSYVYEKILYEINIFSYPWNFYRLCQNVYSSDLKSIVSDVSISNIDDFLLFSKKMYDD